jgi:hypothetical protein
MDIDKGLNKINLQRITSFQHGVGEFFFDAITHLLKFYKFKKNRKNSLVHL